MMLNANQTPDNMGWSFRKSKSVGPFRFNLSSSGVGMSFGVKGARISVSKKGTFVNLGANGIYYRQRIDTPGNVNDDTTPDITPSKNYNHSITTGNVETVTDVDSRDFINEMEQKGKLFSFFVPFGVILPGVIMLWVLSYINQVVRTEEQSSDFFTITKPRVNVRDLPIKNSAVVFHAKQYEKYERAGTDSIDWVYVYTQRNPDKAGYIHKSMGSYNSEIINHNEFTRAEVYPISKFLPWILIPAFIAWSVFLYRQDKKRKTLEIYYTMDDTARELHETFLEFFKEFTSSKKIWQNLNKQDVHDAKYHAGASQLVSRVPVAGIYKHKLPFHFLKTNISIPSIKLRNTELYFFPERLILKRGTKYGAIFYKNISIISGTTRFIEEGSLPSDASIVDYTWKYLNKSGGPDRRFNNNRKLPICLYSEYYFQSDSGLNEVVVTSKSGGMDSFSAFVEVISKYQRNLNMN